MTKKNSTDHCDPALDIDPAAIYRVRKHGERLFGYKHSQLAEKIKSGEIPKPDALSSSGRAKGWTGRQIIDHRNKRLIDTAKVTQ